MPKNFILIVAFLLQFCSISKYNMRNRNNNIESRKLMLRKDCYIIEIDDIKEYKELQIIKQNAEAYLKKNSHIKKNYTANIDNFFESEKKKLENIITKITSYELPKELIFIIFKYYFGIAREELDNFLCEICKKYNCEIFNFDYNNLPRCLIKLNLNIQDIIRRATFRQVLRKDYPLFSYLIQKGDFENLLKILISCDNRTTMNSHPITITNQGAEILIYLLENNFEYFEIGNIFYSKGYLRYQGIDNFKLALENNYYVYLFSLYFSKIEDEKLYYDSKNLYEKIKIFHEFIEDIDNCIYNSSLKVRGKFLKEFDDFTNILNKGTFKERKPNNCWKNKKIFLGVLLYFCITGPILIRMNSLSLTNP